MPDIRYDTSLVSFFDILGFSALVGVTENPGEILRTLRYMTTVSTPDPELAQLYEKHFVNFSDTVVRLTNVLSETNRTLPAGIVFHEILDLLHIQIRLVDRGIFVRGAVVIDQVYHAPPFTFGPGIVKAYEIESKRAVFPRIVVDGKILALMRQAPILRANHHSAAQEEEYLRKLLCKYGDDEWFVDYLRASESECDNVDEYLDFLVRHKHIVEANLARYAQDARVYAKYDWLARYHNDVISEMSARALAKLKRKKRDLLVVV